MTGDQPLMDHRPLQGDVRTQPRLDQGTNAVITFGWLPARDGAQGGIEGESSARYFLTVRQSTPHSRAISA
jgi:hypothetical protein